MDCLKALFSIDIRSLALLRVGLALLFLINLYKHFQGSQIFLFLLAGFFAILFILGHRTRFTNIVLWIFVISFQSLIYKTFDNGDLLLRILLFWSIFLPLGAKWSMDRAFDLSFHKIPERNFSIATIALWIQLILIYAFNYGIWQEMLINTFALIIIIPSILWNFFRGPNRFVEIYYDADCHFCLKLVLILKAFFLNEETQVRPAQEDRSIEADLKRLNSWVLINYQGRRFYKFDAVLELFKASLLTAPFAYLVSWIFPLKWLGNRAYECVAANRSRLSPLTSVFSFIEIRLKPSLLGAILILVSMLMVIWFYLELDGFIPMPGFLKSLVYTFGLNQNWVLG